MRILWTSDNKTYVAKTDEVEETSEEEIDLKKLFAESDDGEDSDNEEDI